MPLAWIHKNIILPLSDIVRGERVCFHLRQLRSSEEWSEGQWADYIDLRTHQLMEYCAKEVPFYREWFAQQGIDPSQAKLQDLPIVDKPTMRHLGTKHFSAEHFPEKERLSSRSSGSTGEPFVFYESRDSYSANMACKLASWHAADYRLGQKYMKIANSQRASLTKRLQDWANNCIYISFPSIDEATLRHILDRIERSRPLYLRTYPAPLHLLARFRMEHTEYKHRLRHVFTTGATLPEVYREEVRQAFGCDVIDSYSCEGTPATFETTAHDEYRTARYYGLIEVVDDEGRRMEDGIGRVVSTDFFNLAHPFLRYDTQDLVRVEQGKIVSIIGRESECFLDAGGSLVTVHNLTTFFCSRVQGVEAYRMVRKKSGDVEFHIVTGAGYNPSVRNEIIDYWSRLLALPVRVCETDHIPLMKNNKYRTIIDELTD